MTEQCSANLDCGSVVIYCQRQDGHTDDHKGQVRWTRDLVIEVQIISGDMP